jgi:hypothetical protein
MKAIISILINKGIDIEINPIYARIREGIGITIIAIGILNVNINVHNIVKIKSINNR